MIQAVANGSVRGRAALTQIESGASEVILDDMARVITESCGIR